MHRNIFNFALFLALPLAQADLVVHLSFDSVNPAENAGVGGAITWGSAPTAGDLQASQPGLGQALLTNNNKPWTQNLNQPALTFDELTISFWNNGGATNWDDFISWGVTGSNLKLERTAAGQVAFYQAGTFIPGFAALQSTTVIDGDWHHIALTLSKSLNQSILYVDGAPESNSTWAGANTAALPVAQFQLASELGYSARSMTTLLDEVRMYNQALSPSEIASLAVVVPEPSTWSLVMLGWVGIGLRHRRRSARL